MTDMMTLEKVQDMVRTDDTGKSDLVVARRDIRLESGKLVVPSSDNFPSRLEPSAWATGQLTSRLGIPTSFFRKLPPDVQDPIFNHFVAKDTKPDSHEQQSQDNWLLRCQGETLRGVLSERYRTFDNIDVLASLSATLPRHLRIVSCQITETSLHLRIVNPTAVYSASPGDDLLAGIHVTNSEVGFHSIIISLSIHRMVCSNGLIKLVDQKNLLSQRHCITSRDHFNSTVSQAISSATALATLALDQFIGTIKWAIPGVDDSIKALGFRWNLSQSQMENIGKYMRNEFSRYEGTGYALINGITALAQERSAEERFDLERLAGSLLDDEELRSFVTCPPPYALKPRERLRKSSWSEFDVPTAGFAFSPILA